MKTSLSETSLRGIARTLRASNDVFTKIYPGETGRRQPVHTVYGGAHLFRADTAQRLGQVAERSFAENASDFVVFARAIGLPHANELPDVLGFATGLRQRLKDAPEAVRQENGAEMGVKINPMPLILVGPFCGGRRGLRAYNMAESNDKDDKS